MEGAMGTQAALCPPEGKPLRFAVLHVDTDRQDTQGFRQLSEQH